jgi:hypothetical protein
MWYTIGTIFLPGVIAIIISCYYPKLLFSNRNGILIVISSIVFSFVWYILKLYYIDTNIEPMLVGLIIPIIFIIKQNIFGKLFSK